VGLFLGDATALTWTPEARALLRAAVAWAAGPRRNQPPVVSAGGDLLGVSGSPLSLSGAVSDDGLSGSLAVSWGVTSQPAGSTVGFADPTAASTSATFSAPGSYTLELRADDGEFAVVDALAAQVVEPSVNQPPAVQAGPDVTGPGGVALALSGSVSDDGLSGTLSVSWGVSSQPPGSTVSFADPTAASTTATFSAPGSYTLELRADDGQYQVADVLAVSISAAAPRALLVSSSRPAAAADVPVVSELQALGWEVEVVDDDGVSAAQAGGHALVVISSTVGSDKVGGAFTAVTVPVVVWEPYVYDDMAMTGSSLNSDYAFALGQSQIAVVDHGHALAGGYSGGVTVSSTAQKMAWGVPSGAAQVVATLTDNPARAVLFGYEAGALLVDGAAAPARRVGLFLGDATALTWTPEARALLRAAVQWATGP
jgi:hypothetical protein